MVRRPVGPHVVAARQMLDALARSGAQQQPAQIVGLLALALRGAAAEAAHLLAQAARRTLAQRLERIGVGDVVGQRADRVLLVQTARIGAGTLAPVAAERLAHLEQRAGALVQDLEACMEQIESLLVLGGSDR